MANDSLCFLEQTDFSLLLARAAGGNPLRLEALQEIPLADPAALGPAVRALFGADAAPVVCALRPKPRALHLAAADEARRFPGLVGARAVSLAQPALSQLPPAWLAAASARDGAAPGDASWLLSAASAAGYTATSALLESLPIKPVRRVSATFNAVGAISAAITAPVWLLEIGELGSQALLVSRDGVLAAGSVSLNLDRIAEAVQAELGLKFRGSAVKLFFNPDYDYNEAGPKIAAKAAAPLKAELAALRGAHPAPIALACTGLPAAQQWFARQLAAALEIAPFTPEAQSAGLAFANQELEAAISPAWFAFLHLAASSRAPAPAPWATEWLKLDTIAPPAVPKPAPAQAKAAAPVPAAPTRRSVPPFVAATPRSASPFASATKSASPFGPATAKSATPFAAAAVAAVAPEPVAAAVAAKPAAPKPAPAKAAVAAAPAPVGSTTTPPVKSAVTAPPIKSSSTNPAVSFAPKSNGGDKPAPPKRSGPPPVPVQVNTLPMAEMPAPRPLFKNKVFVGILTLAVVLGLGGYFFVQAESREAERLKVDKARAEAQLQAEIAKAKLIEQKAAAEAAARKKAEADAARKLAEVEAARQRAESDARAQAAARLANARGTLVIDSDPAGATVTVGNLPPRTTPATFTDLKIGKYPVTLALNLYDTVQLELEVKEDATTDTGAVKLNKILGSLELVTEPDNIAYEVRPASSLIVLPDARRTGRTPATLTDLIPGDYTVTFERDGWMPQTETVTIVRDVVAHVKGAFPNGSIRLTSTPAGAIVTRDGVRLGVTPLTLADQLPGDVTFGIGLAGYASDLLKGHLVGGQTLELATTLEPYDHLSKLSELDQQPKVIATVQPVIPYEFRLARRSAQVNIELTVTRDGSTKDLVVMPGSDRVLAPACLAAAAQWKFKPGSKQGRPANVRVIVPFSIEASD